MKNAVNMRQDVKLPIVTKEEHPGIQSLYFQQAKENFQKNREKTSGSGATETVNQMKPEENDGIWPGMVANTCDLSTLEAETGGL
jgi:hypothetical protein